MIQARGRKSVTFGGRGHGGLAPHGGGGRGRGGTQTRPPEALARGGRGYLCPLCIDIL